MDLNRYLQPEEDVSDSRRGSEVQLSDISILIILSIINGQLVYRERRVNVKDNIKYIYTQLDLWFRNEYFTSWILRKTSEKRLKVAISWAKDE